MKKAITSDPATMLEHQNQKIEEVFERERKGLLAFIRRRLSVQEDAEDVLQEVFAELIEVTRLMQPVEQFASWLFKVARNRITDRYRKKKPILLEDLAGAGDDNDEGPYLLAEILPAADQLPDEEFWLATFMESLDEALEELPAEQRQVFRMHELEGKSFQEIAEITGESVNTLLSRKRYAVQSLRKRLLSFYEELFND